MRSCSRGLLVIFVVGLSTLGLTTLGLATVGASHASAQEPPLQAANGAALYLGSLEGVMVVGAPIALAVTLSNGGHLLEGVICMALLPLCVLFLPDLAGDVAAVLGMALLGAAVVLAVPPSIAGVGGAEGWDADGSLVLTTGVHGLLEGGLLGGAFDLALDGEGGIGAVIGGLALGAATSTYAALRHTELTHDPRTGVEANFLMWSPPVAMLLGGLVMAALDVEAEIGAFVTGLLGLVAQAISIAAAEVALSEPPPVMMAPMMLTTP